MNVYKIRQIRERVTVMQGIMTKWQLKIKEMNSANIEPVSENVDFYKSCWMVFIGSVVGFVFETLWCLIKRGRLECRSSLLLVPFTIVYGVGALVLYIGLHKIDKDKITHIFTFGFAAGSVVEFLFSFLQEKFFGTVSWDYSARFFNISGRICLIYSVFWGLLAVLWVLLIQPFFQNLIMKIPKKIYKALTLGMIVFIGVNIIISVAAVARWNTRLDGIPAVNTIAATIDKLFPNEMMNTIYPNMVFGN